ncbi:MAG: DUF6034 family protein [Clostridium sp.]|nr:DUF6034 family protein [Clostridium sp.]
MKARKIAAVCAFGLMSSLLITGCQNSSQTEEEIVVPKEEETGEAGEDTDAEMEETGETAAAGSIAEQIQSPEHYTWEGGSEKVSVKADASVVIPEGEGFKDYKVVGRVFNQEDYDRVSQVLLDGSGLWERDWEQMGASNGFTADEIDAKIAKLKAQQKTAKAEGGEVKTYDETKGKSYEETIDEWTVLRENAPETVYVKEVPAVVVYEENAENMGDNSLMGTATVEGTDFFISLDNYWEEGWRWVNFLIERDGHGGFAFDADSEEAKGAGITAEEAEEKAMEAAAAMGFEDFAIAGGEYLTSLSINEINGESSVKEVGYAVYLTRLLDGIPVTYTSEMGTTVDDESATWPYEQLELVYTGEGLEEFKWSNPYQIEKISDEYRFLLPFSEIQGIFEEMLVKKYEDFYAESDVKVELAIDEVRLGYMRVREKGSEAEGEMVPVWDFFGDETIYYPDMEEPYEKEESYWSKITINALDGTVIDRGLGY